MKEVYYLNSQYDSPEFYLMVCAYLPRVSPPIEAAPTTGRVSLKAFNPSSERRRIPTGRWRTPTACSTYRGPVHQVRWSDRLLPLESTLRPGPRREMRGRWCSWRCCQITLCHPCSKPVFWSHSCSFIDGDFGALLRLCGQQTGKNDGCDSENFLWHDD